MAQGNPNNRAIVTSQDGMNQDVDKLNHPNSTFRYSLNCRISFNEDGTFSWTNERGMVQSFLMTADGGADTDTYLPIGADGQNNLLVMLTTCVTSGFSEIGIVILNKDGLGAYKTLFNDQNDPNSELLNLKAYNQCNVRFLYENDNLFRIYWVDGVASDSNQPRVFTFKYDEGIGGRNDVAAYSAVTTSVHSMNSQAEFRMGLIKYQESIGGNLSTGVYQYTYRLVTTGGYQTPWYPLSRTIFLTSDTVTNSNWNQYEMEGAGIVTSKGNRIEIKGIDTRFTQIEVAYVYSKVASTPFESNIFSISAISGTSMVFDHTSNSGEPINFEEIPAIFQGIRAAKTLNVKENTLYYGNIKEGLFTIDADAVLENAVCEPYWRDMRCDEKNYSGIGSVPVTHAITRTGTITKRQHNDTGGDETYQLVGDYVNYKGTQVEHLFPGHWRGETYRFGIVFFDKLGFPSFVYHLADITFPEQYQNTYSYDRIESDGTIIAGAVAAITDRAWLTNNFGAYTSDTVVDGDNSGAGDYSHARIMGVKFGGIDITSIANVISGFQIVRCKLDKTILLQGLIMPCVRQNDITRPLPSATQHWVDFTQPFDAVTPSSDFGDIELNGLYMDNNEDQPTTSSGNTFRYLLRPNISVFYAPDFWFNSAKLPTLQSQDRIRLVGGCWTYGATPSGSGDAEHMQYFTYADHCVQKLYYTKNDFHLSLADSPYPLYGSEAEMNEILNLGMGSEVAGYAPGLDLHNSMIWEEQDTAGFNAGFRLRAWGKDQSLFLPHGNFSGSGTRCSSMYLNFGVTNAQFRGYFLANYKRPNANPYGGQTLSALERNLFMAVGHFQPVGNPTFAIPSDNIFDEVEVWGGDCYVDMFGYLRGYPNYWGTPNPGDSYGDAAYGQVFPFESCYPTALRQAASSENPMYSDVGSRPNAEFDSPGSTNWPNGLFTTNDVELREEFNMADCMSLEEVIQFYNPKPIRFQENTHFPVRWRWTQTKIYGEPIDQWRIFQVNDFRDLDGRYGSITSSGFLMDSIYSWQESAFGRLMASDRTQVEDPTTGTLTLGTGGKMDGIEYKNTKNGNQHQWSLSISKSAAYWIDVSNRKICRFAQDGFVILSDMKGMHQFAEEELRHFENIDNPVLNAGISSIYDYKNDDIKWSFCRERIYRGVRSGFITSHYSGVTGEIIINSDDLVDVEYTGNPLTQSMVVPVGDTGIYGNNNLLNFYLYVNPDSTNHMPVGMATTGVATWFTAMAGTYYQIYRKSINDNWSYLALSGMPQYKRYNTLTFSEVNNHFQMFESYDAHFFANTKDLVMSYNTQTVAVERKFFVHSIGKVGKYYNADFHSLAEYVISENGAYEKIFDNMYMNCNSQGYQNLVKVLMYTESLFQQLDMTTETRKEYQEDKLRFPLMEFDTDVRMRGKHMRLILDFSNTFNRYIIISNLEVLYRLSARI